MSEKPPLALEYIRAIRDDRTLLPSEKLAAILMASHAGHDGDNAHPGHKLLGEETGTSARTSERIVPKLVKKGWLVQTSSGRGNNRYASVYRLAIPQGATDCTLGQPATDGGMETSQPATGGGPNPPSQARQPATGGGTNQPVEITLEIPVSQSVTDDMTGGENKDNQDQGLTGQEAISPAAGEAGHDWEDYPSGEALVEDLNEVLAGNWPREDYPDAEPFDARFLRGGAKRLDELVRVANRYQFAMAYVVDGMCCTPRESGGLGRADHSYDRVTNPARLVGKVLSGPVDQIIAYGERGKKIAEAFNQAAAASRHAMPAFQRAVNVPAAVDREAILALFTGSRHAKRVRQLSSPDFCTGGRPDSWEADETVPVWRHDSGWAFSGKPGLNVGNGWTHGYTERSDWEEATPVELG